MSIVQTQTTSFKVELYQGVHNFTSDVFKIALYTGNASLNESTTQYTSAREVVGSGYSAGGVVLTGATINASGSVAYVNFNNVNFNAAVTARCALIYNTSKANKSVAVLDFGSDKSSSSFAITMPANTATTALIRSSN
jgi:hypothetical protein